MPRIHAFLVLLAALACAAPMLASPVHANTPVPDDVIVLDLSTEGFVSTQSANVTISVDAAADDAKAATLRADMQKAVDNVAKAEWRLTSLNRMQDQTGLTRWQALYEGRVAEPGLAGIADRAKTGGKAGMQLRVANIDFTPTLAETEARRADLRAELLKKAQEELARVNAATSPTAGRAYRIASVNFSSAMPVPIPHMVRTMAKTAGVEMMAAAADMAAPAVGGADVAQRLTLIAQVVFATQPPAAKP